MPVKNSLVPCGSGTLALTVFDTSGNVVQSTYLPIADGYAPAGVIRGDASTVDLVAASWGSSVVGFPVQPLLLTQLSPNDAAETVQLACVANAANFDHYRISGGELVSLFGEGLGPAAGTQPQVNIQTGFPIDVANTEVTFNGSPVPLLYVQDRQINAIAPWSLQPGQTAEVCVLYKAARTNCLTLTVEAAHPGVFTVDGYHAFARNQDWSINSATNPAKFGSYVTVWATGLGALSPQPADGSLVGLPLPVEVLPAQMYSIDIYQRRFWFQDPGYGAVCGPRSVRGGGSKPNQLRGWGRWGYLTLQVVRDPAQS